MARRVRAAAPRAVKWYEHTVVQIIGITVPVLVLVLLATILATRAPRVSRADRARLEVAPSPEERFFHDRPTGEIGAAPVAAAGAKALNAQGRPDAHEQRLQRIRGSEDFTGTTLDEVYALQDNAGLDAGEREARLNGLMGRRVLWKGVVERIRPKRGGKVELTIASDKDVFQRAFLEFPRDERRKLRVLREGHTVEASGVVSSIIAWPFLEGCTVLRSWGPPPEENVAQTSTAEARERSN